MTVGGEQVFATAHGKLLRAAYVVAAGERDRAVRWSRAHRLVAASLPWRPVPAGDEDVVYRALLSRVLRRAMRPRKRLPLLGSGWGRAGTPPGGADHAAVDEALARVTPPVRAAYLLIVGEQRSNATVNEVLGGAGVANPGPVIRAAQKLAMELVQGGAKLSLDRQQEVLDSTAMNPKAAWLRPPAPLAVRGLRLARWAGAAVAVIVIAVIAGTASGATRAAPDALAEGATTVHVADPQAWRTSARPALTGWPARGSQVDNAELIRAATRSWRPPDGVAHLLFAGEIGGSGLVLLTDGRWVARYSARTRSAELTTITSDDIFGTSVLRLGGGRYLVAPWVVQLELLAPGGATRLLAVTDGISEAVDPRGTPCDVGPVLRVTTRDIAHDTPFVLGDLGRGEPAHLMYLPADLPAAVARPHEMDAPGGPAAFESASCRWGDLVRSPMRSLTVWEFHAGPLPDGGPPAKWLCVRADRPDGNATSVLLAAGAAAATQTVATTSDSRLCSRLGRDIVGVTWWQSPTGKWHLLAAGSREVDKISVTVDGRTKLGRGLVVSGPFTARPTGPVAVTATSGGNPVPVVGPPAS